MAKQPTTEDYFQLLASRAAFAAKEGNYAIAAALVIRDGQHETIFEGWNTLFATHQPGGHAEMNAIRLAAAMAQLPDPEAQAVIDKARQVEAIQVLARESEAPEQILYTTLEPCPMCTVCLINAGVERVIIASEDPPSGALASSRLHRLPELWPQLARANHLDVVFCQSADSRDPLTYLPAELHDELLDRFAQSREDLDQQLSGGGVLDFGAASSHAWALLHAG